MSEWADIRGPNVVLEDEAVLVLNKPAGISVMGERHETDLVRMAAAAGEDLFPVHRIDKVTSGAVLVATELRAHGREGLPGRHPAGWPARPGRHRPAAQRRPQGPRPGGRPTGQHHL